MTTRDKIISIAREAKLWIAECHDFRGSFENMTQPEQEELLQLERFHALAIAAHEREKAGAQATPQQFDDLSGVQVCCGEYASCHRPCTPRGRWQASQDAGAQDDEADELLRHLGLDPDTYRTDGGAINHLKVKAALRYPENYPRLDTEEQTLREAAEKVCNLLDYVDEVKELRAALRQGGQS